MHDALFGSLSLIDATGYAIIALIVVLLGVGVALTAFLFGKYAILERDLKRGSQSVPQFEAPVLNRIVRDLQEAARRHRGELNTQAIIEHAFQAELSTFLVAERFVRATTGLMIILGLVGTFYGLTLSIGKLVALVSADVPVAGELTASLTRGLTDAISGMSVAFSTSLFGIAAAIVMTLLGVFANVGDRRTAVMVQIESYLDNVLMGMLRGEGAPEGGLGAGASHAIASDERIERLVIGFGQTVAQLDAVVSRFENTLEGFSASSRDFREFNLHLRDNIQRMSLSFADLSESLKREAERLRTGR